MEKSSITAAETFSSLRQTIKSKFVSEVSIPESERNKEPEPAVVENEVDDRPLYFQLKDNRAKNEEAFEDMFKLSKRIKKVDEEEYAFLKGLDDKEEARQREIKEREKEGVKLFKIQQAKMTTLPDQPPTAVASLTTTTSQSPAKPKKDVQKEVLCMIKKRAASPKQSSPKKTKTLVVDYPSDSE